MFWNMKELSQDVEELLKYCDALVIFIVFNSLHSAFFVVCCFFFIINFFEKMFHEYHQNVK